VLLLAVVLFPDHLLPWRIKFGHQEIWVTEAVCGRLGYAGLKPITRKQSGVSWTVGMCWRAWQLTVESLNASKFAPESLCHWEFCLARRWSEPLRKTIFAMKCLRMTLSCPTIVPHFIWCHILHSYKHYITIIGNAGNETGIGRSLAPLWWKIVWEWDYTCSTIKYYKRQKLPFSGTWKQS